MPKFSSSEKENLYITIKKEAKYLFTQFGLKKTGISEITKASGISQGAFYSFFQSKEELYFSLLEDEESVIKSKIADVYLSNVKDASTFVEAIEKSILLLKENTFLNSFAKEDINQLLRKLPQEQWKNHLEVDLAFFEPIINTWAKNDLIKPVNLNELVSALQLIILSSFQPNVNQGINFLLKSLSYYLFKSEVE